ncbi:ATP-dependent RNA helicase DDX47-like [Drosophila nasuta]|uniref:ATP-dependent RNA helicase DDX47-like n=1 Tax=Drosophila nasuta TaxID=42062 RepID=UPI00295E3503|nr:ATP-dependent RNA helicase DDX47-like [Drosophila nasuta]
MKISVLTKSQKSTDAGEEDEEDDGDDKETENESDDDASAADEDKIENGDKALTWKDLGLNETLCKACDEIMWKAPSKIQKEAIPIAIQGKDVIGLVETGSGKTGAFALPILHALLENPQRYFALVLTPPRELAFQIGEQFEALVSNKYQTVDQLQQYYLFIPVKYKDVYLVHILNELAGNSFMIFCSTCNNTVKTALMLRALGLAAIPLHGQMSQNKRLAALNKFKAKNRSILISTDVASRGLDIPHVDVVVNFDIPTHSKDYIHRVERTARAGRSGQAITMVSQYDIELYQRIEHLLGKQLPLYKCEEDEVMALQERVAEAQRIRNSLRVRASA